MSSLGATVHLPATHHVLLPSDLLSWNCTGALELLQDPLSSSAAWTYLDGSASFPHFGSAFAVFEGLNATSCNVTASVSPLQSSGGSEFWALHLKLHHLQTHPNPNPLQFVLCDNANVVDCYRLAKHPDFNLFHKHPSGHWIKSFRSAIVQLSAQGVRVEVRWIKCNGHAFHGFPLHLNKTVPASGCTNKSKGMQCQEDPGSQALKASPSQLQRYTRQCTCTQTRTYTVLPKGKQRVNLPYV